MPTIAEYLRDAPHIAIGQMANPMAYATDPRQLFVGGGVGAQATLPSSVSSPEAILGAGADPGLFAKAPSAGWAPPPPAAVPPAATAAQASGPPPTEPAAPPAAQAAQRDPLCSASIEYLRAHGVPGKPSGWLERVERELCSPELAQYDIPICPERQAMKFGTTYARQIDTLG
jgi:hypothetical protein